MWQTVDFECTNTPVESNNDNFVNKLFVKIPFAIG